MATLRDIQRRIRSVQSTQKITRAMKLVAAAKLRRAQERILAARPYAAKMGELLGNLVTAASGSDGAQHPLLEQREGPRRQIVIITADKGLAGAFNSNVIRRALDLIRQSNTTEVTLVVVGRKARDFYRRRPWTIKRDMIAFWDRLAYSHASELADYFMQQYLDGEVDEVSSDPSPSSVRSASSCCRFRARPKANRPRRPSTISTSRIRRRSSTSCCRGTYGRRCSEPSWNRWPGSTARA
jgi:F-type H+-transporting ATPase subunit gamma